MPSGGGNDTLDEKARAPTPAAGGRVTTPMWTTPVTWINEAITGGTHQVRSTSCLQATTIAGQVPENATLFAEGSPDRQYAGQHPDYRQRTGQHAHVAEAPR
jgi:hypothetical protein